MDGSTRPLLPLRGAGFFIWPCAGPVALFPCPRFSLQRQHVDGAGSVGLPFCRSGAQGPGELPASLTGLQPPVQSFC